jgi:hypothetical protein
LDNGSGPLVEGNLRRSMTQLPAIGLAWSILMASSSSAQLRTVSLKGRLRQDPVASGVLTETLKEAARVHTALSTSEYVAGTAHGQIIDIVVLRLAEFVRDNPEAEASLTATLVASCLLMKTATEASARAPLYHQSIASLKHIIDQYPRTWQATVAVVATASKHSHPSIVNSNWVADPRRQINLSLEVVQAALDTSWVEIPEDAPEYQAAHGWAIPGGRPIRAVLLTAKAEYEQMMTFGRNMDVQWHWLDRATTTYQAIQQDFPETMFATSARRRIDAMARMRR